MVGGGVSNGGDRRVVRELIREKASVFSFLRDVGFTT